MLCSRWVPMSIDLHPSLSLPDNSFKVEEIRCNTGGENAPSVQLLAIKPIINKGHTDKCKYKNTEQKNSLCALKSPEQWAHFHVTSKGGEDGLLDKKHYIILFVERNYLSDAQALFKIFSDTVNWLKISEKKLGFHVIFFGVDGFTPALTVVDNNTETIVFESKINRDILRKFGENKVKCDVRAATEELANVKKNKNKQAVLDVSRRKPTMLTIMQKTGESGPYMFNVAQNI